MDKYLGIDIGGTTAKCAIVSDNGGILSKKIFTTGYGNTTENFLKDLYCVIDSSKEKGIKGVGICCVGVINSKSGEFLGGLDNMPYLEDLNLKKLISERYPDISVSICNDVKAVARGEQWLGAGKGCKNFFCITLGTGLGGALILNSQVVEGSHFRTGEIAYLDYKNPADFYERHVSTKCVMEIAAKKLQVSFIDGIEFFDKIRCSDVEYMSIFDNWVKKIAQLTANLIITLDVEKIIIGGGISNQRDLLIPKIRLETEKLLPPDFRNQTKIEAAECVNNAGILGAVSMLINEVAMHD